MLTGAFQFFEKRNRDVTRSEELTGASTLRHVFAIKRSKKRAVGLV
jgi:hypothetical protein